MIGKEQLRSLERDGFAIVAEGVPPRTVERLVKAFEMTPGKRERVYDVREKQGGVYAMRNVLRTPEVRELAESREIMRLVEGVLGRGARAVRGIFFDKTPGANWKVAWHQDRSIALRERVEVTGYGPWSKKAGVVHVEPPREVLERMVTVRVHLDECDRECGPLKVVAGSHRRGVLSAAELERVVSAGPVVECEVGRGGVLLMRPLIVHASSRALRPGHRRVVHLEYAAGELGGGLEWNEE